MGKYIEPLSASRNYEHSPLRWHEMFGKRLYDSSITRADGREFMRRSKTAIESEE